MLCRVKLIDRIREQRAQYESKCSVFGRYVDSAKAGVLVHGIDFPTMHTETRPAML